ncbi:MAG TPA: segregation/condensation protein A [Candidatus Acidoferrales bacterium]|nr:segregation/condensation protein A [Candidatus Acidoferrales bacterium]
MSEETQDSASAPQQLAFPFYRVKLEVFEGPLDLLLHLIKKSEVEIADIPIATITEQYLGYLDMLRDLNLDVAGEFLVMAATLTLIKSRMLLPPSEEEEAEEPDPRAELVQQLLEYQRFREAALALSERPFLNRDVYVREPLERDAEELGPATDEPVRLKVSVWELMEAFRAVLQRAKPEAVHEVVIDRISLRDRAQSMLAILAVQRRAEFTSLFPPDATRVEVLATFLALLELMKMGVLQATQDERWGPILIEVAVEDVSHVAFGALDEYEGAPQVAGEAAAPEVGEGVEDGGNG